MIVNMRKDGIRNQTLYTYVRDLKTILYFFTEQDYIEQFKVKLPKVNTTSINRLKHTFAKQWVLAGNSVVALQKILGYSSSGITQHYVNINAYRP